MWSTSKSYQLISYPVSLDKIGKLRKQTADKEVPPTQTPTLAPTLMSMKSRPKKKAEIIIC